MTDESKPQIITVDPRNPEHDKIERAAAVLRDGGLVAFPTETVYGLGADAFSDEAVGKIFEAKGRPATNPLIVHVSGVQQARELARHWPDEAAKLAEAFWPGPLTMVVERSDVVASAVCAGLDTVALRMPSHPVARKIIEEAGVAVAAPSANRYTEVSPTTAEHVVQGLGERVDLVVDAGATPVGLESTLVSVVEKPAQLLRPGMIGVDQLRQVIEIGEYRREVVDESEPRPSPGMAARHYSPDAKLRVVSAAQFRRLVEKRDDQVGLVGFDVKDASTRVERVEMPDDPEDYARRLYAVLHRLDDAGVREVVVQSPPKGHRWDAIRDRLRRAASTESQTP